MKCVLYFCYGFQCINNTGGHIQHSHVSQGQRTHDTELSHLILYAPAFIGEHAEMIQQAVSSCLEQTMLCTEDTSGHIQRSHDVSHKI
jgi:hypothetical protein